MLGSITEALLASVSQHGGSLGRVVILCTARIGKQLWLVHELIIDYEEKMA